MKIGFMGLGLMGSAMVEHLQNTGHELVVLANKSRHHVDAAIKRGAIEAKTAKELAAQSSVILLCLDTSQSVESRVYGDEGILAGIQAKTAVIDFGTSLPQSSKKIAASLAEQYCFMLDAPLGRTPAHALEGKLNIMVGGDASVFEQNKSLLEVLGENVFHVGPLGAGHSLKLLNNFVGMTTACAISEAFSVAEHTGLSRQTLYDVMSAGPLHSAMMDFVAANALEGDTTKLAFSLINAHKDVGYYRQMSEGLNLKSILSSGTFEALSLAVDNGHGHKMVSEMVDILADPNKK